MSDTDNHNIWDDELAAYVVGALDAGERAAFEGHLVDCERCRAELSYLAPAVVSLPLTVERIEPPTALRGRIMDAVGADTAALEAAAAASDHVGAPKRSWRDLFFRPAPVAGLAALLAVAFVVGFAARGGGGGVRVVREPARPLTAQAVNATLVLNARQWQLRVRELPALRAGEVYQMWIERGRALLPATLFVLSRNGQAAVPVNVPVVHGDVLLVTAEPAGGSAQPTTRPILQANTS